MWSACEDSITLLNDQPDLQKELIDTINEASSTSGQRYDVVHGHWYLGRKKEEAEKCQSRKRKSFSRKLRQAKT